MYLEYWKLILIMACCVGQGMCVIAIANIWRKK